jgi:hypothetical protein
MNQLLTCLNFNKMKKILLMFLFVTVFSSAIHAQSIGWSELGTGKNALDAGRNQNIVTIVTDQSGNVYAAGRFTNSDGYNYVAKWNGTYWAELASASDSLKANGYILTLAVDNAGNVYAAGYFTNSSGYNYVAKWNGSTWTELGTGSNSLQANNIIYSVITDNSGNVYAAGFFKNTLQNCYVAKWNGSTWTELGTGNNALNANYFIAEIVMDNSGNIYASGGFSDINNDFYVAKWNGTTWSELGTGSNAINFDSYIYVLATDNSGNVYAGSSLNYVSNVSKWNGSTWTTLGTGSNALNGNNGIDAMILDDTGNVYVGGDFSDGTSSAFGHYVAKWNGTSWSEMGIGKQALKGGAIYALAINNNSGIIYAGGILVDTTNNTLYVAQWGPLPETTSITSKLEASNLTIYPNPSTGIVHILDLSENVQLNVTNVLGESVYTQQLTKGTSTVDLSNLSPGMYTLVFSGQQDTYLPVKWIKE